MSWLFSQALGEAYSAGNYLDGEPYAQLNVMPTPHKFWRNDKTMEFSNLSRFGLTLRLLTESHGEELLTWFLEDSRARTSAPLEKEQELQANAADCGKNLTGLLAKWNPVSYSWKTAQCSLFEDLELSLEVWPRAGSMRNGACYQRPMLAHPISEKESGLWPTPNVPNGGRSCAHVTDWRGADGRTAYHNGKKVQVGLEHAAKHWPTPTASLGTKGARVTPRKSREGGTLIEAVSQRAYATPTARDWRSGKASQATMERNSRPLSEQVGGSLNPTWVEWLMGWPLGWTDLKPLETDKFQEWQQQHSLSFQGDPSDA